MKIMIIGLGSIGRRHFRNLRALGVDDLVLVRKNLSTLPEDELKGFPVEWDIQTALEKHNPDGVVVTNPTSEHLETALPAINAGKAVLLEKPISNSLDKVAVARQAIAQSGTPVLVGFQFRYHPTLNKAREILQSGGLGMVLTARAHWGEYLPNWHPWEPYQKSYAARKDLGGGVTITLTHPIDYLRFLLGEIVDVRAQIGHISPLQLTQVEDVSELSLRFASGAIGGIHLNYFQRPPSHHFEIVGTKGTLRWDNADGKLTHYELPEPFGVVSANPTPAITKIYELPKDFDRNDLFIAETRHFLNIIEGKETPICTFEDGVRALEIALKARGEVV